MVTAVPPKAAPMAASYWAQARWSAGLRAGGTSATNRSRDTPSPRWASNSLR